MHNQSETTYQTKHKQQNKSLNNKANVNQKQKKN